MRIYVKSQPNISHTITIAVILIGPEQQLGSET